MGHNNLTIATFVTFENSAASLQVLTSETETFGNNDTDTSVRFLSASYQLLYVSLPNSTSACHVTPSNQPSASCLQHARGRCM